MSHHTSVPFIVLGLGAYGSSILYQLARRGVRVLGLDRYRPPHKEGSSHGESRITRLAIGEGEFYTPYALRSHEIWRELESDFRTTLYRKTGGLVIGMQGCDAHFHGKDGFFARTVHAAKMYGIQHEILDALELRRRFPDLAVADDEAGYLEEDAGVLFPERCIETNLVAARSHGAVTEYGVRIARVSKEKGGGIRLEALGGDVYVCERLVIAAGPWVREFLPPRQRRDLHTHRQVLQWYRPSRAAGKRFAPERFPVFIWERESFYGFPDTGTGEIKVASGEYGTPCRPDRVRRSVSQEEVDDMRGRLSRSIPALGHAGHTRSATCIYTVASDGNFVVDRHPTIEGVTIVSACSGHGFKHSPAVGELAAKLVLDDTMSAPEHFSFKRFGTASA